MLRTVTPPARSLLVSGLAALALAACGDPSVDKPDAGGFLDASQAPPPAPIVAPIDSPTPYRVVTIKGRAVGARRVVVEGGSNPVASAILPDSSYCMDVPTLAEGTYSFTVFAQGNDGQLSEPAGPYSVTVSRSAPPIVGARTCSGSDPAGCSGAVEICGNNRDDDCNNLIDDQDPTCAPCTDDIFEENDDVDAPRIEPDRYENLQICPGDPDFYGVFIRTGEMLTARAYFRHAEGNLDMHLIGVDRRTVLMRSTTLTDDESLTYTATTTGEHKLRVFGDSGASNSYTLVVGISGG